MLICRFQFEDFNLNRQSVNFIHPVHAVFPYTDLSHDSISTVRFLELLEGLDPEIRYLMIDDIATSLKLKPCERQYELEKQLKRFRRFKKALLKQAHSLSKTQSCRVMFRTKNSASKCYGIHGTQRQGVESNRMNCICFSVSE